MNWLKCSQDDCREEAADGRPAPRLGCGQFKGMILCDVHDFV